MKIKALIFLIVIILGCTAVQAQKSKPKSKKATAAVLERPGWPENSHSVPELKDFAYVVEIDENSNISLTVQNSEDIKFLTNTADLKPLGGFFSGVAPASKTAKPTFKPIVIIRADPSLNYGALIDVITKIRSSTQLRIKLETGPAYYVFIPVIDTRPLRMRPNPLSLVASMDSKFNIKLNMEPLGTLDEPKKLTDFLLEIFKARGENGVFREGSNEVEKTVFVKADRAVDFKDVIKLIEVLRRAGASPIGLQVDDIQFELQIDEIK